MGYLQVAQTFTDSMGPLSADQILQELGVLARLYSQRGLVQWLMVEIGMGVVVNEDGLLALQELMVT